MDYNLLIENLKRVEMQEGTSVQTVPKYLLAEKRKRV
jgi:hypothetical protein